MVIDFVGLLVELSKLVEVSPNDIERAKEADINEYQMNVMDSFERAYRVGKYDDDIKGLVECIMAVVDEPDYEPNTD